MASATFKKIPGKISITIDAWTSPNYIAFLGITAHWVNKNWEMEELLIEFVHLKGPHSGDNMATAFMKALEELGILAKVSFLALSSYFLLLIYTIHRCLPSPLTMQAIMIPSSKG